ncbi:uncharacterized protein LOC132875347 [Neoarius graeffei]|uniref:uncharacterized protein LOC132875347 n=1 Tax=Neoarius graeffei TaxID=443677 RepID=UPI00298D360D|nr:uncharacterized protein LOC132875347 [Neoarius graeffei]
MVCYWTTHNVRLHVVKCRAPNTTWAKHPVKKTWYETDSYAKAEQKCLQLMESSSVETEDDVNTFAIRQRKCPRRFVSESSDDDDSAPVVAATKKQPKTLTVPGSPVCQQDPMPLPPQWSTPAGTGASPHHPSPSPVDPVQASSRALHPIQSARHLQESLETSFDSVQASSRALHDGQGVSAIAAMFERITEAHMSRLMRRLQARFDRTEARFDKIKSLVETNAPTHTPQLQQDDVVLAKPCSMVMELLELDRSLEQPDKRNKMQHFLETVGGAGLGAAIHRMLRRVANNEVLAQYSLRGRWAKMSFDDLILCKIIKAACVKKFPGHMEAEVEECLGQTLKFAPHRRSAGQQQRVNSEFLFFFCEQ